MAYINADSAIEGEQTRDGSAMGPVFARESRDVLCPLPTPAVVIAGMYTLRVDCTPSLHTLVYDITKKVPWQRCHDFRTIVDR